MTTLADALDYFNDIDDDEILRLHEQANAIVRQLEGSLSVNVAAGENNLGSSYKSRARRAHAVNDVDRCIANMELALPHFVEAARIFRANNHVDSAENALRNIAQVEGHMRKVRIAKATAVAVAAATNG